MSKSKNTGNYKLCRKLIGISRTTETLLETRNLEELKEAYRNAPADKYEYYCEEEVIYLNTHRDAKGNPMNSAPTWIRMHKI